MYLQRDYSIYLRRQPSSAQRTRIAHVALRGAVGQGTGRNPQLRNVARRRGPPCAAPEAIGQGHRQRHQGRRRSRCELKFVQTIQSRWSNPLVFLFPAGATSSTSPKRLGLLSQVRGRISMPQTLGFSTLGVNLMSNLPAVTSTSTLSTYLERHVVEHLKSPR